MMPAEDHDDKTVWPPAPSASYLPPLLSARRTIAPWFQAILAGFVGAVLGGILLPLLIFGLCYATGQFGFDGDAPAGFGLVLEAATFLGTVLGAIGGISLWRICRTRKR